MKPNAITTHGSLAPRLKASLLVGSLLLAAIPLQAQWTNYVECEDYNFESGQYISDATSGMDGPYLGGAYTDKLATPDIDLHIVVPHTTDSTAPYRLIDYNTLGLYTSKQLKTTWPGDWDRGYFQIVNNWKVSWQEVGEWQNYTRVFSNAVYTITLRAAHATSRIKMELALVTSDPTQYDQTTDTIGGTDAPPTNPGGTDHNRFELIPMIDGLGQPLQIRLSGTNTLRLIQRANSNLDWLRFTAIPGMTVMPPYVLTVAPVPGTVLYMPTPIDVLIKPGDNPVDLSKVRVLVNGTDVTAFATISATGSGGATLSCAGYEGCVPRETPFNVQLIYGDTGSPAVMVTNNWSLTSPALTAETAFVEAEDYNYGSGQYISDATDGMAGPYYGAAYAGLVGTPEVDYHVVNPANDGYFYRFDDTYNGVGFYSDDAAIDRQRPTCSLVTDYSINFTDSGEWFNYTRVFTNSYYAIYARAASPAGPAAELSLVTSDPTQTNQVTKSLGAYARPGTANYLSFTTAQFTNGAGQPLCVRLSGATTLRLTMQSDGPVNWLAFVPVPASAVPRPILNISRSGSSATLSWTCSGFRLQSKARWSDTWADVSGGATSPVTVPASGLGAFLRLTD